MGSCNLPRDAPFGRSGIERQRSCNLPRDVPVSPKVGTCHNTMLQRLRGSRMPASALIMILRSFLLMVDASRLPRSVANAVHLVLDAVEARQCRGIADAATDQEVL